MKLRAAVVMIGTVTALMTSACSGNDGAIAPRQPGAPSPDGGCLVTAAQWAVGERATADLLERARVAAGASTARFLLPNQPITLEYLASRLNLEVDDRQVVRTVRCG